MLRDDISANSFHWPRNRANPQYSNNPTIPTPLYGLPPSVGACSIRVVCKIVDINKAVPDRLPLKSLLNQNAPNMGCPAAVLALNGSAKFCFFYFHMSGQILGATDARSDCLLVICVGPHTE